MRPPESQPLIKRQQFPLFEEHHAFFVPGDFQLARFAAFRRALCKPAQKRWLRGPRQFGIERRQTPSDRNPICKKKQDVFHAKERFADRAVLSEGCIDSLRSNCCQLEASAASPIASHSPFIFNNLQFNERVVFQVSWGSR
jgi:hypothetical protein